MSELGSRIYSKVHRPDRELVDRFLDLGASDIADCMGRMGGMRSSMRAFNQVKLVGTAFTVKLPGGNNLLFHVALSLAQEGDVIVVDGEGCTERGVSGENMIELARQKGVKGFVVDGAIRDVRAAVTCDDFAVYAKAIAPNAAAKGGGPGEINVPVSVGGVVVFPGDIVVGDEDGVVVVPAQYAAIVAEEAMNLANKQAKNLELIKTGTSDRTWVSDSLNQAGYEIMERAWGD
jgi:regulator of RNase E activity RraA